MISKLLVATSRNNLQLKPALARSSEKQRA